MVYGFDPAPHYACRFVLHQDPQSEIDGFRDLKKKIGPGEAIKICTAKGHEKRFYTASSINTESGVSYYSTKEFFRLKTVSGYIWNNTPPGVWQHPEYITKYMKRSDGGIVHHDDDDFVITYGLSPKEFYNFSKKWDEFKHNRSGFEKAISNLYFSKQFSSRINSFKRFFYINRPKDVVKLTYIGVTKRNIYGELDLSLNVNSQDLTGSSEDIAVIRQDLTAISQGKERISWISWILSVKFFNNQLRIYDIQEFGLG